LVREGSSSLLPCSGDERAVGTGRVRNRTVPAGTGLRHRILDERGAASGSDCPPAGDRNQYRYRCGWEVFANGPFRWSANVCADRVSRNRPNHWRTNHRQCRHGRSHPRVAGSGRDRVHEPAATRHHRRRFQCQHRERAATDLGQRAAAAGWSRRRGHGGCQWVSRVTQHRQDPGGQLVPEQRSALYRRRDTRCGLVYQLAESQ